MNSLKLLVALFVGFILLFVIMKTKDNDDVF